VAEACHGRADTESAFTRLLAAGAAEDLTEVPVFAEEHDIAG
jgi:hypothetical protein